MYGKNHVHDFAQAEDLRATHPHFLGRTLPRPESRRSQPPTRRTTAPVQCTVIPSKAVRSTSARMVACRLPGGHEGPPGRLPGSLPASLPVRRSVIAERCDLVGSTLGGGVRDHSPCRAPQMVLVDSALRRRCGHTGHRLATAGPRTQRCISTAQDARPMADHCETVRAHPVQMYKTLRVPSDARCGERAGSLTWCCRAGGRCGGWCVRGGALLVSCGDAVGIALDG